MFYSNTLRNLARQALRNTFLRSTTSQRLNSADESVPQRSPGVRISRAKLPPLDPKSRGATLILPSYTHTCKENMRYL